MPIEYLDKAGLDHLIAKIKDTYQTKLTLSSSLVLGSLTATTITAATALNLIGLPGTSSGTSSAEVGLLPTTSESGGVYTYGITFTKNSSGDVTLSYHDGSNNSVRVGKSTTSGDMRPYLVKNGAEVGYFITNSEVDSKISAIDIPEAGNAKISFKINGKTLADTFTVNQTTDKVINLGTYLTEDDISTDAGDTPGATQITVGTKTISAVVYGLGSMAYKNNVTKSDVGLSLVENKALDTTVAASSGNYITSGAVKTYVDGVVKGIHQFEYVVIGKGEDLPTASADTMGKIYLRYHAHTTTDSGKTSVSDVYDEYITIYSATATVHYTWEKIGNTDIDLSGYVPISRKINKKALTADITLEASDILTDVQQKAVNSGITSTKVSTYDDYADTISTISGKFDEYLPKKNPIALSSDGQTELFYVRDTQVLAKTNFVVDGSNVEKSEQYINLINGSGSINLQDGQITIKNYQNPDRNYITVGLNTIDIGAYGDVNLTCTGMPESKRTSLSINRGSVAISNGNGIVSGFLRVMTAPVDDNDVLRLGDYSAITNTYIDQQFAAV